jgi:hypothetical protein
MKNNFCQCLGQSIDGRVMVMVHTYHPVLFSNVLFTGGGRMLKSNIIEHAAGVLASHRVTKTVRSSKKYDQVLNITPGELAYRWLRTKYNAATRLLSPQELRYLEETLMCWGELPMSHQMAVFEAILYFEKTKSKASYAGLAEALQFDQIIA